MAPRSRYRFVAVAMLIALSAMGAIYKWVDEKGVTHYTETPPPGVKAREIAVQPAPPSQVANEPAKSWQDQEREFNERRLKREAAEEAERQADLAKRRQAAVNKARCEQAQRDLYTLGIRLPVFTIDERGERAYVDDKDRPAAIEGAKRRIAEYCTPP